MVEPWVYLIVGVAILLIFIILKVPIGISLGMAGIIGLWWLGGWGSMFVALKVYPYMKVANWSLVPLPLFIIMGYFAAAGGITEKAYATAHKLIGRLPGSLALATTVASAMFGACCGSSVATAGVMGKICIPEMLKYGYSKRLACGATACAALLAIMIPPSIMLIIYGSITGESVGKLLIGGIIPGILTVMVYSIGITIMVKRDPKIAPTGQSFSWIEKIKAIKDVWGVLILALVIIGGIYTGVFTPSEAAAVGSFAALVMALVRGRKAFPAIRNALEETARTTSMIFLLIIGSTFFSFFLTTSGATLWLTHEVLVLPVSRMVILALVVVMYLGLGMIVDPISMLLITLPIVYPIIIKFGFNGIWFGIIVTQLTELATITPPVGMNLYVIKGVAPPDVSLEDVLLGSIPFILMQLVVLVLLIAFPQIALFLPSLMR